MRPIDGDALKREMGARIYNLAGDPLIRDLAAKVVNDVIDKAPTVDTTLTKFRCGECRYWQRPTRDEQEAGITEGRCKNKNSICKWETCDEGWYCGDGAR